MTSDLQERLSDRLHAEAAQLIPDDAAPPRLPARSPRRTVWRLLVQSRWRAPVLAAAAVVAVAAVTALTVAQQRDGTATPAAGDATSAARTGDPHLSPILDGPAPAFECRGTQTGSAARTSVAIIGIASSGLCVIVLPQARPIAATGLLPSGPLRGLLMTEGVLAAAVAPSVDGVAWIPEGATDVSGTTVDLYSLGSLRGFAFPVSSGGTVVLYAGQTVVAREKVPAQAGRGAVAGASSQAAPAGSARAARSYPPGEGPSPKAGAWPTNARGQTYGTSGDAQRGEPDLIAAVATNGRQGYVLATELSGPMPTSLSQAAAQNTARSRTIPVYESDGVTQIGVFVIQGR